MVLGAIWYGPLFGSLWLRVIGKAQNEVQSRATMVVLPLAASLISSHVLAALIRGLALTGWRQGLIMGVIVWLGVGATATLTVGTFEDSPRGVWLLFAGYQLVVRGLLGIVFSVG